MVRIYNHNLYQSLRICNLQQICSEVSPIGCSIGSTGRRSSRWGGGRPESRPGARLGQRGFPIAARILEPMAGTELRASVDDIAGNQTEDPRRGRT
jgi:hypothetical protein